MKTEIWNLAGADEPALERGVATAAALLRGGELVAFPTETVYGLGADALNPAAVAKIFAAKGRPQDNPLIVHVAALAEARRLSQAWPALAERLALAFWPGPLTLVVPAGAQVPGIVTAGLNSVGLRMPAELIAARLLQVAGCPVAAPSANLSGRPSPTRGAHVVEDFEGKIAGIIVAEPARIGLESTVVDCTGGAAVILRPGFVTREQLEQVVPVVDAAEGGGAEDVDAAPRSPGMKYTHYAPRGSMYLLRGGFEEQLAALRQLDAPQRLVAIVCSEETAAALQGGNAQRGGAHIIPLGARGEPAAMAANLFAALRQCDALGAELILAETYAETGVGAALMNRLRKAAGGRVWQG